MKSLVTLLLRCRECLGQLLTFDCLALIFTNVCHRMFAFCKWLLFRNNPVYRFHKNKVCTILLTSIIVLVTADCIQSVGYLIFFLMIDYTFLCRQYE